jgi:hypothetical protein
MKSFRALAAVVAVSLIATHTSFAGQEPTAPEIDPGLGMGALAFLSGAIMVIRGRLKA